MVEENRSPARAADADPAADSLETAARLVEARGAAAQLCVLRDGQVVLDRSFGCAPDALFWTFSAGKPFIALAVHGLAQAGVLSLDDPVARWWPRFGARGKQEVTIRQVLAHRSGLYSARGTLGDALAMTDWDRSVRRIERAALSFPPGQVPAYQPMAYGFVLGEAARRATGSTAQELVHDGLIAPLALPDTYLGLPEALLPRAVPVSGRGLGGRLTQAVVNRPATRRAVIPSAGVSTTARDMARFYQVLLDDGRCDGAAVLDARSILEARRPGGETGEVDRTVRLPIRWGHGFQLGGPSGDPDRARPMGRASSPQTFGHNGSNTCLAWADPTRRLVFAYLTDRLSAGHEGARHFSDVSDAVLAACT
jgi:CubicO group peptidase (beta-lactamase class C family)